ncbi:NAD(P)/FAD-dependent oxidoreductase [Methylobacterium oryzae CBMB20]
MTLIADPQLRPTGAPYDPTYDPLTHATPGTNRDYAPTYWVATAGPPPADDGPITGDTDADVVIVGSGFTGLSCALSLARDHGIKATVLEANRVAWGCSTRNGGQGQTASGRLSRSQWLARYGRETALKIHAEIMDGFEYFTDLVREFDPDPQAGGHIYVAHRPRTFEKLAAESALTNEVFGYQTRMMGPDELKRDWLDEVGAVGALHEPSGHRHPSGEICLRLSPGPPARPARRSIRQARCSGSSATARGSGCERPTARCGRGRWLSPQGATPARVCTRACAAGSCRSSRTPSSPDPLTPEEVAATFRTTTFVTDTRTLRFYYRLLPDNRVQIGSRSAITGADATHPRHLQLLIDGLHQKFPVLKGIHIDYSWWGWVDVSHDMMPRIVQPEPTEPLFYSLGYGGTAVSPSRPRLGGASRG